MLLINVKVNLGAKHQQQVCQEAHGICALTVLNANLQELSSVALWTAYARQLSAKPLRYRVHTYYQLALGKTTEARLP